MDNLCHTLAGAALGEAGLKRATPWGNATLMLSANLPDVDVLALFADTPHVALRRGWTHGVAAQALLPIALTGLLLALDRLLAGRRGRAPRLRPGATLLLSYLGLYSHIFLDYLNGYGVRLLKPLSDRWYYGDALFIIDPWLWLVLGAGVFLARRRASAVPAVVSVGIATAYIAAMMWLAAAGRENVLRAWTETHGAPPGALMVGPVPFRPLEQQIIVDAGDHYVLGQYGWWPRRIRFDRETIPKNDRSEPAQRAREDPRVQGVLVWARFPYYRLVPVASGVRVTLEDARYGERVGSASVIVPR
jgi:inner membrane protein